MDIKNRVSQVRSYLEGIGQAVTAVQGHEVVARALGYKNKHTLAAASSWLEPATFTTLKLCFEASATAGYHSDDGANAVSWNLTPELWARVLAAQALCDGEGGFEHVCLAIHPSDWTTTSVLGDESDDEDDESDEDADVVSMYWHGLHVDKDSFWFEGWAENSDIDTVTNRLYFNQLPAPLGTSTAGFVTQVENVLFATSDRESVRSLAELLAPEALQALDSL